MSLRNRLFLWISALLLSAGLSSYILEVVVTKRELRSTREQLRQKIEDQNEKRRQQIVRFTAEGLQEVESKIELLLDRLSTYPLQAASFAPTQTNIAQGTWVAASEMLLSSPWLDFIQSTYQDQVLSLIVPDVRCLQRAFQQPIEEGLAWISLGDKTYFGIQMGFLPTRDVDAGERIETRLVTPVIYFLFDEKTFMQPKLSPLHIRVPWMDGAELDVEGFNRIFARALAYLETHPNPPAFNALSTPYVPNWIEKYDLRYLIWGFAAIHRAQLFGNDLFTPPSPQGVALYPHPGEPGQGVDVHAVFFSNPRAVPLPSQLTCTPFDVQDRVYLGRTIPYHVQTGAQTTREGFLTLGVDIDKLADQLRLALNQQVYLVHDGKFYPNQVALPLDKNSGIVTLQDREFYFTQITPLPDLDLHFFLLNPVEVEFALLNSLNQGAQAVVQQLLQNIHVVGLVMMVLALLILHYLSRRITEPITRLATVTSHVGAGRLNDLDIPMPADNDTDEVASLCRSFHQMVRGLQEKEKVQAVLNKVVSQEIAQEILKGNIHLGGEEKKVTVLFADIRHFTQMTQNMPPQEVVELLNGCMTKISHVIDQCGGVIDKYVGDEVMALFGAPVAHADSSFHAVKCAEQVMQNLTVWNKERAEKGLPAVQVGIGIHTGDVLAGNMGAENRLNYTVLGSNVNLASRLCSIAAPMEIFISEAVMQESGVGERIMAEALPPQHLKGFDVPIVVYRVTGLK